MFDCEQKWDHDGLEARHFQGWDLLFHSQKKVIRSKNIVVFTMFWQFFTAFPLFMLNSKSLLLLSAQSFFFIERRERFAIIALYKRATVSDLLTSLLKKSKKWAMHSKNQRAKSQLWKSQEFVYLLRHANNEKISIIKKNSSALFPFNRIQRPIILDWIWGKGCRTCRGSGLLFFKGPGGIFANNDSLALAFRCSFKNYKL